MRIPLPKMMRAYRAQEFDKGLTPGAVRFGLNVWHRLASRPGTYRAVTGLMNRTLSLLGRWRGNFAWMPLASGWTDHRDLPAPPSGGTFQSQWAAKRGRG